MKSRFFRRRGFTLIEIMIVMVIVGALSAMAIPTLNRLKMKSEETMVLNTLRQVYEAKEYYFTETGAAGASVTRLVAQGYASKSLAVAVGHPPGSWNFSTLAYLKPGKPVSSAEVFHTGNHVIYGRKLQYPSD